MRELQQELLLKKEIYHIRAIANVINKICHIEASFESL